MPFLQIDSHLAIQQLQALYSDLTPDKIGRAVAQGINITLRKARTQTSREIRSVYNIRHGSLISKVFKINKAYKNKLFGDLSVKTQPIHMEEFMVGRLHAGGPINTATPALNKRKAQYKSKKGPIGGISVKILKQGPVKFFAHAFISPTTGNMVARSVQDGNKFSYNKGPNKEFHGRNKRIQSGRKDSPIGAFMTVSPFSAAVNKVVQRGVYESAARHLDDNIMKQLYAMRMGYIRDRSLTRSGNGRFK